MKCLRSSHDKNGQVIRRVSSSSMTLLMIASFLAALTSVPLSPTIALAAPAPFPPGWVLDMLENLKNGRLSLNDLTRLKNKSKNSPRRLNSLLKRVNETASSKGIKYRLEGVRVSTPNGELLVVYVTNQDGSVAVNRYPLGPVNVNP